MMSETRRILLIDDDTDFCEGVRSLLESHGYTVDRAPDGTRGVEMARACRPDLILLDVMMTTDTEGFEVSRQLKEIDELRECPVILMTGIRRAMNLPFGFEQDAEWLPVKAVLEKPVPPEKLLAEVEKHLAG
jgi:CheY-like chemotaxis protein